MNAYLVYEKPILSQAYNSDSLIFKIVYFNVQNIKDTSYIFENRSLILDNLSKLHNVKDPLIYAWVGKYCYGAYIFNDSFSFTTKLLNGF